MYGRPSRNEMIDPTVFQSLSISLVAFHTTKDAARGSLMLVAHRAIREQQPERKEAERGVHGTQSPDF